MPKLDKQCPTCNRSLPGDEIQPSVDVVRAELAQLRKEKASAAWDERRAHIEELAKALIRDPDYPTITRLTSLAVFTAKQLTIAERMINGHGKTDSTLGD